MKKQCQVEGCTNLAKYGLYYTNPENGNKEWLYVCIRHEKTIGDENLQRWEVKSEATSDGESSDTSKSA